MIVHIYGITYINQLEQIKLITNHNWCVHTWFHKIFNTGVPVSNHDAMDAIKFLSVIKYYVSRLLELIGNFR